jgi:hypothetical protein
MPDDVSLIWVPKVEGGHRIDVDSPKLFETLDSNFQPLCGLRFGIRANREVSRMELVGPGDDFNDMAEMFRHCWNAAEDFRSFSDVQVSVSDSSTGRQE